MGASVLSRFSERRKAPIGQRGRAMSFCNVTNRALHKTLGVPGLPLYKIEPVSASGHPPHRSMTIVIIPATSRTNTYVINALLSFPRPPSIRLVAHTGAARMRLQEVFMNRPNVSTTVADLLDPSSLRNALNGARIVFYNGPVLENEAQMGKNVVDAACAMDIEKLVYCSVLHPFISQLPHHRSKLECVSRTKVGHSVD
jgi:hypothetical protein